MDDHSWDDLTTEQRIVFLEEELERSLQELETTADGATWRSASDSAIGALSTLRPERMVVDPQRYRDFETRVERLTDTPPLFARGQ